MIQKEKEYSFNLVGFKRKMNILVRIKEKVKSLAPSLVIKLSQVLSHGCRPSLGRITLNSRIFSTLLS